MTTLEAQRQAYLDIQNQNCVQRTKENKERVIKIITPEVYDEAEKAECDEFGVTLHYKDHFPIFASGLEMAYVDGTAEYVFQVGGYGPISWGEALVVAKERFAKEQRARKQFFIGTTIAFLVFLAAIILSIVISGK